MQGVWKRFGQQVAVQDLSLQIPQGEVFALLGPNGAGKSTTIRMLTSLTRPSQGSIRVGGYDVVREERQAWEQFLQLAQRYPDAPIYHFHGFEVQTCRRLGEQYRTDPRQLRQLLQRFVDLQAWVQRSVVLPIESYSLKNIARWLGFQWRLPDANGAQSIYWYSQWLETRERRYLEHSLIYNEDDCRATHRLKDWLSQGVLHAE
jgi:predicted RecB family nuclease